VTQEFSFSHLEAVEENFKSVMRYYRQDMKNATTEDEVEAITENYWAAKAAWEQALRSALRSNDERLQAATAQLLQANETVKAARARGERIEALAPMLKTATTLARAIAFFAV